MTPECPACGASTTDLAACSACGRALPSAFHEPSCATLASVVQRAATEGWTAPLEGELDDLEAYFDLQLERFEDIALAGAAAESQQLVMQALETLKAAMEETRAAVATLAPPGERLAAERQECILEAIGRADGLFRAGTRRQEVTPSPPRHVPSGLPGPLLRHPPRGAMIQGCMLLFMAMAMTVTFAPYYAGFPRFHAMVATVALVGLMWMGWRTGLSSRTGATVALVVPAAVSAAVGYSGQVDRGLLELVSALLYMASTVSFVVINIIIGVRARAGNEAENAAE